MKKAKVSQADLSREQFENRQRLSIICACRSGIITCDSFNKNIPADFKDKLNKADEMLHNAQALCCCDKYEENTVVALLKVFQVSLRANGLNDIQDMTTTIAVSQTALDYLRDFSHGELSEALPPIIDVVNEMGAFLHDGLKMKNLQEKFDRADMIVEILFRIINFKV